MHSDASPRPMIVCYNSFFPSAAESSSMNPPANKTAPAFSLPIIDRPQGVYVDRVGVLAQRRRARRKRRG